MNRNGNSRRGIGADVLEDFHQDVQSETAFYDPSNPVLAPAKEIATGKRKNWKRKLIGWSFVVLLLVISGLVLYALLRINHVDVKVLADNRRDSSGAKPESDANKTENGLSAEAINIAREAVGTDPVTAKPSASPGASPSISPDTAYRLNYSATMNPGMGPATDFGTINASSNQQAAGTTQPEARTVDHSLTDATLQSRANQTQSIFVDDAPKPVAALPKTSNMKLASSLEDKTASKEKTKKPSTVLPPFGTMLPVRTQAVILTVRNNSYARLELTRNLTGEGWSLPKGTILIGHTSGGELERAFVNVIGYLDPRENRFVKMTGEVLGADGGAGLQGKRIVVDRNRFKQTLSKVASSGLQVAGMMAGALTGRGTVVLNGAGYRLLNPVTDEAGQLINSGSGKRAFVKVEAGQPAYVMVADLPKEIRAVDAPGDDELARVATSLTDREVMELILFGTPEETRAALPLMNEEQRGMVAKTIGTQDGKP
jgi:cytoskeletal protein RodZ